MRFCDPLPRTGPAPGRSPHYAFAWIRLRHTHPQAHICVGVCSIQEYAVPNDNNLYKRTHSYISDIIILIPSPLYLPPTLPRTFFTPASAQDDPTSGRKWSNLNKNASVLFHSLHFLIPRNVPLFVNYVWEEFQKGKFIFFINNFKSKLCGRR